MRIAFVGKGGSGKTTLSALFSQLMSKNMPVLAIDADINLHLSELLGFGAFPTKHHISHPESVKIIKTHLRGTNNRIAEFSHFRKTTPPARGSNLIHLTEDTDVILNTYTLKKENLRLMAVGTYDPDDIGASCFHNNLAILENVLSHLNDVGGVVVTDMVAGVDAFANTLHAQFDLLVLTVEPTQRGVQVFNQYYKLAEEAGVADALSVVGNKVRTIGDETFIRTHIPAERLLGFFKESDYLRTKDQTGGALELSKLEDEHSALLKVIERKLVSVLTDPKARLQKLYELHRRYVAQDFIRERFGDLTHQIDIDYEHNA